MTALDISELDRSLDTLSRRLLDRRAAADHWDGHLAGSALSTGTAVLALETARRHGYSGHDRLPPFVTAGTSWLIRHQNADGGWGDTVRSRSNISTTAIVWATLASLAARDSRVTPAVAKSEAWLRHAAGDVTPDALRSAILRRYGKDQTFSVPILTVLALAGKLGDDARAWRSVPQLPFELAAFPHAWFQYLQLPVVSYALPALIAIGHVRHHFAPTRNPIARSLRTAVHDRTHAVLREIQPESGGYLEATPLTSFVVMSLAGMRNTSSPVVENGVRFLEASMREDGSWPIDTNLSTWVTTLATGALADAGTLPRANVPALRRWIVQQQSTREHPFTHAAPGAWAWTPLSGGVPDADDTAGALVALRKSGEPDRDTIAAAAAGCRWLLGLQNRDGGVPTFCRGWGTLPFDRSTPEITAHALQAWSSWSPHVDSGLQATLRRASDRAIAYLAASQTADGTWIPLWFGNERAPDENSPVYGTSRTLLGLQAALVRDDARAARCRQRGVAWLLGAQQADGGWGGDRGVAASIEETGVALAALGRAHGDVDDSQLLAATTNGTRWLIAATSDPEMSAAPVGLYFARLWYYEALYPLIFGLEGLAAARVTVARVAGR